MTSKLNSFILSDNVINKMKNKVEFSRSKDIEVGFNLCTENSDNQLHDESHCLGYECSVDIPKGCKKGKFVGIFHTHSHTSGQPSIQDIANAYQVGINCIGSTEEKDIKCYIRNKTYKREELENIVSALIRYESPLLISKLPELDIENYRKWIKARNDLKKHYLNTIVVNY